MTMIGCDFADAAGMIFRGARIVVRGPATVAARIRIRVGNFLSWRPGRECVSTGRLCRRITAPATGARSVLAASFPTHLTMRCMSKVGVSGTTVSAVAVSAVWTAAATSSAVLKWCGETDTFRWPTCTTSGAKYASCTAAVASTAVIPPTTTDPIWTPSAMVPGGGVPSARAWLAPTPRAQTTRQRMKAARLATGRMDSSFRRRRLPCSGRGRQQLLVQVPAPGGVLEDHPVGDPLDRRAVVRPRLRARGCRVGLCGQQAGEDADPAGGPADRRLHAGARDRAVESEHELVELQRLPREHLREDGAQRACDAPREPMVAWNGRDVESHDPAGAQARPHEAKELLRGEIERHVRLAVRVDEDCIEALVRASEERPRVRGDHVETANSAESHEPPGRGGHVGIELDAVDRRRGIEHAVRACRRAARV